MKKLMEIAERELKIAMNFGTAKEAKEIEKVLEIIYKYMNV